MGFVIFQIKETKRQDKDDGQEAAEPMTEFNFSCRAITMLYLRTTGFSSNSNSKSMCISFIHYRSRMVFTSLLNTKRHFEISRLG